MVLKRSHWLAFARILVLFPILAVYLISQIIVLDDVLAIFPFSTVFEPHATLSLIAVLGGLILVPVVWLFPAIVRLRVISRSLGAIAVTTVAIAALYSVRDPYFLFWREGWGDPPEYYWGLNPIIPEAVSVAITITLLRCIGIQSGGFKRISVICLPALCNVAIMVVRIMIGYPVYRG